MQFVFKGKNDAFLIGKYGVCNRSANHLQHEIDRIKKGGVKQKHSSGLRCKVYRDFERKEPSTKTCLVEGAVRSRSFLLLNSFVFLGWFDGLPKRVTLYFLSQPNEVNKYFVRRESNGGNLLCALLFKKHFIDFRP